MKLHKLFPAFAVALLLFAAPVHAGPIHASGPLPDNAPSVFVPAYDKVSASLAKSAPAGGMPVTLNFDGIYGVGLGNRVRLTLPDATSISVTFDRVESQFSDSSTWIGHLTDHGKDYRVFLSSGSGDDLGQISTPEGTWRVVPSGGGFSWLVHPKAGPTPLFPTENDGKLPPLAAPLPAAPVSFAPPAPMAAPSPLSTIDLMILYTNGYATAQGANLNTRLNQMVAVSNQAYVDSEVAIRLRVVHTAARAYTDSNNNGTALNAISPNSGTFDAVNFGDVEALRASKFADLVTFIRPFNVTTQGGSCGVAWINGFQMQDINNAFWKIYGYSVVSDGSDSSYYCLDTTLVHELGHNMGLAHDRPQTCGVNPCAPGDFAASGLFNDTTRYGYRSYGFGYGRSDVTAKFYTVMAYGTFYPSAPNLARFSNPNLLCQGTGAAATCGVAENVTVPPYNTAAADEARALNDSRLAIANFQNSPGIIRFTVGTTSVFENAGSLTVSVERGDGSNGAVAVSYATVAESGAGKATAAADYTATSGTLSWANGETGAKTFNVPIVNDGVAEGAETFLIQISAPTNGATLGTTTAMTVTINDSARATRNDFNGDGKSDILWRNSASGEVYIWLMNGVSLSGSSLGTVPLAWTIVGTGDINGDGRADILWRNPTTGDVIVWLMNGASFTGVSLGSVPTGWQIVGFSDFDGDGRADILWRESTTGEVYIWFMNGATIVQSHSFGTVPLAFAIVATGDTNADGKSDILWRNTTTGDVYLWLMNGTTYSVAYMATVGLTWQIMGLGDYNGDSRADILWRESSSGQVNIWYLNGSTLVQNLTLGSVPTAWEIKGLGSYDADPKADILWRHSTGGDVYLWSTTGLGTFTGQWIASVPTAWNITGP